MYKGVFYEIHRSNGFFKQEPRKNTNAHDKWTNNLSDFIKSDKYKEIRNSFEFQELGICRAITFNYILK